MQGDDSNSRAVNSVIRSAADAITNLAHEISLIKNYVRIENGIPPLVKLLESTDLKVQRAVAGALRMLAFKNDEKKNQIVGCNAFPALILMLQSDDASIHYEAVIETGWPCPYNIHFRIKLLYVKKEKA